MVCFMIASRAQEPHSFLSLGPSSSWIEMSYHSVISCWEIEVGDCVLRCNVGITLAVFDTKGSICDCI